MCLVVALLLCCWAASTARYLQFMVVLLLNLALLGLEGYGGRWTGEKEEGKHFSLGPLSNQREPNLKGFLFGMELTGTCIIKNVQVPPLLNTSLKSLVTAWPQHGRGSCWPHGRAMLCCFPSMPAPAYRNEDWDPMKSNLNAGALWAAGIFLILKCSTCAGNGLVCTFTPSPYFPLGLHRSNWSQ